MRRWERKSDNRKGAARARDVLWRASLAFVALFPAHHSEGLSYLSCFIIQQKVRASWMRFLPELHGRGIAALNHWLLEWCLSFFGYVTVFFGYVTELPYHCYITLMSFFGYVTQPSCHCYITRVSFFGYVTQLSSHCYITFLTCCRRVPQWWWSMLMPLQILDDVSWCTSMVLKPQSLITYSIRRVGLGGG